MPAGTLAQRRKATKMQSLRTAASEVEPAKGLRWALCDHGGMNEGASRQRVSSRVGGMAEQVEHGANGLLYPAGDIEALAAALEQVADAALRSRLGQGALATARERFSLQQMLGRYDTLFRSLAR